MFWTEGILLLSLSDSESGTSITSLSAPYFVGPATAKTLAHTCS